MNPIFRKSLGLAATLAMLAGPALAQPYPDDHGGPQHGGPGHPPHANGWHQGDHFNGNRVGGE